MFEVIKIFTIVNKDGNLPTIGLAWIVKQRQEILIEQLPLTAALL